jgi:threonine dehydrogenase-like Zn-dependent dehydrogenase
MFPGGSLSYPYTAGQPGHEATGDIVAVGAEVDSLKVGERVACWRDAGHQRRGCYAQYVVMSRDNVLPLPENVSYEKACSLELAMCVQVSFEQLLRQGPLAGRRVGVSGLGPAGIVAVQMAKAYGASEVVGLDLVESRCALGLRAGADRVMAPNVETWPAGRRTPQAVDVAVDCTGLKVSIEYMMDRTRSAVAIFGVLREEVVFGPSHWTGLLLMGAEPHRRDAAEAALALVAAGKLDLSLLISEKLPFTRYLEGVEKLRRKDAIKICYLPWAE